MDYGLNYSLYGSLTTVAMLVIFVGIIVWAWSGKRTSDFAEAARLPLDEDMGARSTFGSANGRKRS